MTDAITPQTIRLLAAEAVMPEATVRKAYKTPHMVRNGTLERLRKAATVLGVEPPEPA